MCLVLHLHVQLACYSAAYVSFPSYAVLLACPLVLFKHNTTESVCHCEPRSHSVPAFAWHTGLECNTVNRRASCKTLLHCVPMPDQLCSKILLALVAGNKNSGRGSSSLPGPGKWDQCILLGHRCKYDIFFWGDPEGCGAPSPYQAASLTLNHVNRVTVHRQQLPSQWSVNVSRNFCLRLTHE